MNGKRGDLGARPPVAHFLRTYLPRTETFIYTLLRAQERVRPIVLAQATENLDEFRFDPVVDLLSAGSSGPGRALRRLRSRLAGAPSTLAQRIATHAEARGAIAIHAHFGYAGVEALWARERLGIPLLTTFYGWDIGLGRSDPSWQEAYAKLFAGGDRFLCEGPAMADQLAEIGCPSDRISVVKIGIDLERFPFSTPARTSPLVILQAARLVEKKGVDISLRAFAAALLELGEAELWIVGNGPLEAELRSLSERLGVSPAVRFLGSVSYARYQELLQRVHVGLQPSRTTADGDTEGGAPSVLLELQARGIPVVATRHADIPQVVPDGDQLPEENDVEGVARVLVAVARAGDAEWRERSRRGRELVEREHDVRRTARQIEDLYRDGGRAAGHQR
jgi:colanic acid/amylovoran biosynthesis glycosyltransferase